MAAPPLEGDLLDHLSPREYEDLVRAGRDGEPWARILLEEFLDGTRLVLGIDSAVPEERLAAAARLPRAEAGAAIAQAARWCLERGLHLLGFPGEHPGEGWRHFMAVG